MLAHPAASRPADPPPTEALALYAEARASQLRGDRLGTISALRKALELDKSSYFLNYELGIAQLGSVLGGEAAINRLAKAAQLEPDHLNVQWQLGKQYFSKGDDAQAIEHLRLAMQTSEYRTNNETAALVDLTLARALQRKGYDLAAVEQYEQFLSRLDSRLSLRGNPELYVILSRTETILMQVGELNEKLGRFEEALRHYHLAAEREPNNFDYQAHAVRALLAMGNGDDARNLAADLVSGYRASSESVELLTEVYRKLGREGDVIDEMKRVLRKRPGDRAISFALADALTSAGRVAEAEKLLRDLMAESGADAQVVGRLFELQIGRGDVEAAARLVIESLAQRPESLDQLELLWAKLARSASKKRLRLPAMQRLMVAPQAEAAKLYWLARTAAEWQRDALMRASLERATAIQPPFGPAYRGLVSLYLSRADWGEAQKKQAAAKLIEQAEKAGQRALAMELRGIAALNAGKPAEAIVAMEEAIKLGAVGPRVRYELATALLNDGKDARAEQELWKIVSDWPTYENAYLALAARYPPERGRLLAAKVLQTWLAADPFNVSARQLQVTDLVRGGKLDLAETALNRLFRDEPDNSAVLALMRQFFTLTHRENEFIEKLEQQRARTPDNRTVVQWLVILYAQQKRLPDAVRALDEMHAAVAGDADQLYYVAHLYEQVDQRQRTEEVLQEVLKIDARNVPACNDLGYMWAEDGKNLAPAEELIRVALSDEPGSAAYLDSLGWVLYKRGKFEEAERQLSEAVRLSDRPDPTVLDHMGDVLYRLSRQLEAEKYWRRSLDGLSGTRAERDELQKLKLQLNEKLKQHKDGQPVNVAPVAGAADEKKQAKN